MGASDDRDTLIAALLKGISDSTGDPIYAKDRMGILSALDEGVALSVVTNNLIELCPVPDSQKSILSLRFTLKLKSMLRFGCWGREANSVTKAFHDERTFRSIHIYSRVRCRRFNFGWLRQTITATSAGAT